MHSGPEAISPAVARFDEGGYKVQAANLQTEELSNEQLLCTLSQWTISDTIVLHC